MRLRSNPRAPLPALKLLMLVLVCLVAGRSVAQGKPTAAPKAAPATAPASAPDADVGDESTVRTVPMTNPPAPARVIPTPGAQQVIKIDRTQLQGRGQLEIFPDAKNVWMHVYGTEPGPVEAARADRPGSWVCRGEGRCDISPPQPDVEGVGDRILVSIGLASPTSPLPIPIWTRDSNGDGVLLFNPILMGRASYDTVRTFPPIIQAAQPGSSATSPVAPPAPVASPAPAKAVTSGQAPGAQPPITPRPRPAVSFPAPPHLGEPVDQATLTLSMRWPRETDAAEFRYIAVQDSCGNARVQLFQRNFSVPVVENAEDSCPPPDGKVLRVFPRGGYFRVTAFNLRPERSDIVSVTYRVNIPSLDSGLDPAGAFLLFPDLGKQDLRIDCGVGEESHPVSPAPPAPGAFPSPPPRKGQAVADQTFVIAPEPLMMGNCRLMLTGPAKGRLQAPLALHVTIERLDKGSPVPLHKIDWIVTQRSSVLQLPPLREGYDPQSRLKLTISSDPFSTNGKVMLLADAARVWPAVRLRPASNTGEFRREMAQAVVISAPLCGGWNVETTEKAGNCLRAYVTVPILLASFQVTRAPWKETAIAEPRIPAGIGLAIAIDSYNPVKQRPFPLALQLGGLYQVLSDSKTGLMAYAGLAPSFPILGKGGATTSLGILFAAGGTYVMDKHGPNEGFKPAAFVSLVLGAGEFTFSGGSSAQVGASAGASAGL